VDNVAEGDLRVSESGGVGGDADVAHDRDVKRARHGIAYGDRPRVPAPRIVEHDSRHAAARWVRIPSLMPFLPLDGGRAA
jgi:hypothetical protein